MSKLRIDTFLLMIVGSALLALLLPATGSAAGVVDRATTAAIFALFFGYGARLSLAEAWAGLRHWRLHLLILGVTFVLFPLVALGILALPDGLIGPSLALGFAYLCLVPSTVQSSITFTSIAGGNVAGAMVSATASNLLGVILTPLLAVLILPSAGGGTISLDSFVAVLLQLLLPFVLGQLSRPVTASFVSRHRKRIKQLDQFVIALVVYGAFSDFFATGAWRSVDLMEFLVMIALCLILLAVMLAFTWWLGGVLHFSREDRIAIMFCGTKKSLATGVPMASVLFAGQAVGLIVLPLMVFHQAQLMACTVISQRLADQQKPA
ncbi:bile acid:sodium symporter family protein [Tessaracoccus antarcticus]|uniref:Bile acid:sodium symporter n=1 Tax=Tessaracoccus antarcticus TaxID=2479848 RepID=A0A3M0G4H5_9ACTN|nr:bile acid:sodium symporter family protein [Tessaracoccus antarcticus]RMB59755.1 bile acid:sodium symporter [Tessaracoccus antarcticus]